MVKDAEANAEADKNDGARSTRSATIHPAVR
jgi:hypothetical protein